MSKLTIYELVKVVRGTETPLTQSIDRSSMDWQQKLMQSQAADGVEYYVRKVQAVTRPFRVVGDRHEQIN